MTTIQRALAGAAVALALTSVASAVESTPPASPPGLREAVQRWNRIACDASGLDHTPGAAAEQIGPGRASRAMAIVAIAVFDAVNAVTQHASGYALRLRVPAAAVSLPAAVATAAHDTLRALYPSQATRLRAFLAEDLARIPAGPARISGVALGTLSAFAILALRAFDGAAHEEPVLGQGYVTSDAPGRWRQDPVSRNPLALGALWGKVRPFVLGSAAAFRVPPPPALSSLEYAAAFEEVKRLGGDGVVTPTERTAEQTVIGIYWAYDGTPSLCAPPRLYNQVALAVADQQGVDGPALARLLALVNVALADAAIAAWESKYHFDLWRPVTAIREADPGTGPTGAGDGNPATTGDPDFVPLGAPASNLLGPGFTPPFPAYPSGHAALGGALFQVLRRFFGRDDVSFTFVSDEFDGVTLGSDGQPRPWLPRTFPSFSAAEEENGQSRIYLGIHWSFDKTEGIAQGRRVADEVLARAFRPR